MAFSGPRQFAKVDKGNTSSSTDNILNLSKDEQELLIFNSNKSSRSNLSENANMASTNYSSYKNYDEESRVESIGHGRAFISQDSLAQSAYSDTVPLQGMKKNKDNNNSNNDNINKSPQLSAYPTYNPNDPQTNTTPYHSNPYNNDNNIYSNPYDNDNNKYNNPYNQYNQYNQQQNGYNNKKQKPSNSAGHKSKSPFKFSRPYLCYFLSAVQITVFIAELIRQGLLTKIPISIKPVFNPLVGPSPYVLINMGARFPPCMHAIPNVTDLVDLGFPCLNDTANPPLSQCTLAQLCGHGALGNPPDQWWRFIAPIFLHGGVLHILFNMLIQLRLGADVEKDIGIIRFFIIYFASGIFGFILGGNFAPDGIASTGCSGSLFGIFALCFLDLFYNWKDTHNPVKQLIMLLIDIVISFLLGLLPGLDNFSHIGGFLSGLVLGLALLPTPKMISVRIGQERKVSIKEGFEYFKKRKIGWWAWWGVRVIGLVLFLVFLIVLLKNFYNGGGRCSWCRYLSCLPVKGWCDIGGITTRAQDN